MKLSAVIAPLIAAKVPHEIIMDTILAFEAQQIDALERRRESDRKRQNDKRSRDVTLRHSDRRLVTRAEGNSSEIEITEKEGRKKESAAKPRGDLDAFRSEISSILDPARVDAIVAVRRKKGATMTAHAGLLLVAALKACPDPQAAADEMVLRNWTSVKPEWLESRSATQQRSTAPPVGQAFNDILDNLQGKNRNDAFSGPTVDASDNGTDRGGPANLVQLHALSSRR